MGQIVTMLISVAGALAVTAVLFMGADRTVDSALNRWSAFTASIGAVLGLIIGAVLQHNGWVPQGPSIGGPFSEGWLAIVISGLIGGGAGGGTALLLQGRWSWSGRSANLRPCAPRRQ